jgi:hypothetical protein
MNPILLMRPFIPAKNDYAWRAACGCTLVERSIHQGIALGRSIDDGMTIESTLLAADLEDRLVRKTKGKRIHL